MDNLVQIYIFIIGVVCGSFFNVCIYRIPEGKSIVYPSSSCMTCNTNLKSRDLIPIVSYLLSRGKCRYCGNKIPIRYALVELLTGIIFTLVYNTYEISFSTLYIIILVSILIIITFIDIDHLIIPNVLIIVGSIVAFIGSCIGVGVEVKDGVFGALICGVLVLVVTFILGKIVKRKVMGIGDIKLFAMLGLFLGVKYGLLTVILSVYIGAIYGILVILLNKINKKEYNSKMPYGPFISISAITISLYGVDIINLYMSLII